MNSTFKPMSQRELRDSEIQLLKMQETKKKELGEQEANALLEKSGVYLGLPDKFHPWKSALREDTKRLLQAIEMAREKGESTAEASLCAAGTHRKVLAIPGYDDLFRAIEDQENVLITISHNMADGHEYDAGWPVTKAIINLNPTPLPAIMQHVIEDVLQQVADS